jgi:hypothetical protein
MGVLCFGDVVRMLFNGYRSSFPWLKWPGRDVDHPSPYCAKVKNEWSSTPVPPVYLHDVPRNNFTFTVLKGSVLQSSEL